MVVSKFILNAKEIEFDGVAQEGRILNYAISEHVEVGVCVIINLQITAQPGPVIRSFQCYTCVCVCEALSRLDIEFVLCEECKKKMCPNFLAGGF